MTPEYRAIQKNTSDINEVITSKSNPSLFAAKLVSNDFISKQAANSTVQVPAFSDYHKVNQLMQAVDAQIKTASNPTAAFETFIRILRELSLDELADKLVKFYSKFLCNVQVTISSAQFFFYFFFFSFVFFVVKMLSVLVLEDYRGN